MNNKLNFLDRVMLIIKAFLDRVMLIIKGFFIGGLCILTIWLCYDVYRVNDKFKVQILEMKTPVILHWKYKNTFWYSIVLKDGNNNFHQMGSIADTVRKIAANHEIGDTLK